MEVLKGIYKKGWLRRWKAFGLTFAIGKGCGVKPKWPTGCKKARSINGQRKTNLMSNAHKKKKKLYEDQHHQCWLCGCEMSQRELQIHHILPLYYYPEFASVPDNLLLLCNRCHIHVHHDPLLAAGLVHDVALKLGVTNPRERFLQTITVNYPPPIQITIMQVIPTINDFPTDKRNCATCQQTASALCERDKRKAHKGYLKGLYGEISGVIYCCVNYIGKY